MFSVLPFFWAFGIAGILLGVFLHKLFLFGFSFVFALGLIPMSVFSLCKTSRSRAWAFVLFIISEAIIFITLFVTVLWFHERFSNVFVSWWDLPLAGTFFLVSSSFAISYYHSWRAPCSSSEVFLFLSIFFGCLFVYGQFLELGRIGGDFSSSSLYCTCISTVGLHFLHVGVGLFLLFFVFVMRKVISEHYATLLFWYWHFVDYIWLWVFLVVYILGR